MDAIFADGQFWQAVGYVLGVAIAAVIGALALRYASKEVRWAWHELRDDWDTVIAQVDEPGDPIISWLDNYIPGKTDVVLAAALPAVLRAIADVAEHVLSEPPAIPPQEVAVGDTAK